MVRVYSKSPTAFTERFSLPLTKPDLDRIEMVAKVWGRNKTEFARELLLGALNDIEMRAPKPALPPAGR